MSDLMLLFGRYMCHTQDSNNHSNHICTWSFRGTGEGIYQVVLKQVL